MSTSPASFTNVFRSPVSNVFTVRSSDRISFFHTIYGTPASTSRFFMSSSAFPRGLASTLGVDSTSVKNLVSLAKSAVPLPITDTVLITTSSQTQCTPLTISIQLKKVTSEQIQLQWVPKGDRRDSPYTVELLRDQRVEANETTNETHATFNKLIPGQIYIVSVEALSCAKKIKTSVTVQADPAPCFNNAEFCTQKDTGCLVSNDQICSSKQAFACDILFKDLEFNQSLYNFDSPMYKMLSERIRTIVPEMQGKLNDDSFTITKIRFKPGSVIASFISLLQGQQFFEAKDFQEYLSEIVNVKFGNQTEITVQSISTSSSTEQNSSWKVAVIVLGVLLGVALIVSLLIASVCLYMRRSGKYSFEPNGLLGKFAYTHL
ncbi:flocculation protein FLO11-like [Alligator mississippiensis]|uniref:Flocculation protein FLO11-like n=1 Tax=Alligator mississippiensis TaxID=8496 RepID=A0A151NQN7_ALLMI|nr:flocculation protein FLO11-like [Alligator mississippiensis]